MGMIDLVAILQCVVAKPRCKSVIENLIYWQPFLFVHAAGPCPCSAYKKTCRFLCICIMLFNINLISGCSTAPVSDPNQAKTKQNSETGQELASIARSLLGVPYLWGGSSRGGLDCSGLVQYAHLKVGIDIPRNSDDQLEQASPVNFSKLQPGDLVFFKISQRDKPSHVGIYTGDGRFIHAPSSGKPVSFASLQNPFWKDRLVAAGRFY